MDEDQDAMDVLTGQVPPWPECPQHREVAHSTEGDEWRWCPRCGWTRENGGAKRGRANGGWA